MKRFVPGPCRSATALFCLSAVAFIAPGDGAAQTGYETTAVADGVYQFRWQAHNGMFVTTDEGVVVFDPIGVEAAGQLAMEIRRVAPGEPIVAIVYSHSDADHATGAAALLDGMDQESAPIIAHEATVAPIVERGSPDQPPPSVTFAEHLVIRPGGREIELRYLGPSHTDNMIVAYVSDARVAFAVDFVSNDRPGFRDLPGWRFPEFFDAVAALLDLPFETIVFGHGPTGDRASIHRQIAYYDDLAAAVRRAVREGLSEDEATEQIRLPAYASWAQYDEWFPLNVRGVYRWVAGGS